MTGFIVSVFPFRNRVSSKEAFEGLELGERKLSRPVLRGPGGRKVAWLLGSQLLNCRQFGALMTRCAFLRSNRENRALTGLNERIGLRSSIREHLATLLVSRVDDAPRSRSELCPQISHLNGPLGGPFIESANDLHEPTSQQDDRAPQYEGNAVEYEMPARTDQLKHSYLHDGVYIRCEISNRQTAHY